ncbi:MAG: pyridoxamine 5'-phosphate oxidase family protein [Kiloniellales bacterium]|nr:pyridoxamine 5'-phosphate oxidase family protein [Kiloniellales bacterium]
MLSGAIKEIINQNTIGSVATISEEGKPCVSPKGTFVVRDDSTLVFANIRSPGTIRNLKANKAVEVTFLDIFHRTACRVAGEADYLERGETEAVRYFGRFAEKWPTLVGLMEGFVVIHVTAASYLTSPIYDVGMKRDDLADFWLDYYTKLLAR